MQVLPLRKWGPFYVWWKIESRSVTAGRSEPASEHPQPPEANVEVNYARANTSIPGIW